MPGGIGNVGGIGRGRSLDEDGRCKHWAGPAESEARSEALESSDRGLPHHDSSIPFTNY